MISRLAGLTLVLLFGMGNIAYSNEASGTGSNDTSKSCEDGATNMAEIYECLDKKRNAQLTHVFNELSDNIFLLHNAIYNAPAEWPLDKKN